MAKLKIPYLLMRNGRPRWEPGPHLRDRGFKGQNLRDQFGNWLSEGDAIEAARRLNVEAGKTNGQVALAGLPRFVRSVDALWENYAKSKAFLDKKPKTQSDYRNKARAFLSTFGPAPVAALTPPILYAWWEKMCEARGHAMANGVVAVLRLVLSHGRKRGWILDNPAKELGIAGIEPRLRIYTPLELETLVAAADAMELWSVGDAIVLALHSGQRQGDVLAMPERILDDDRVRLTQFKTGAKIDVKLTPPAIARIDQARARKRATAGVVAIDETIVVYERTGRAFVPDTFQHRFAQVRAAAIAGIAIGDGKSWHVSPCPSLAGALFLDLRDTYVTRSALAGNDAARIAAVTGHSMRTVHTVLRHYLALQPEMADEAQDAITAWMAREGIAL